MNTQPSQRWILAPERAKYTSKPVATSITQISNAAICAGMSMGWIIEVVPRMNSTLKMLEPTMLP